jgi:hypothetical protein
MPARRPEGGGLGMSFSNPLNLKVIGGRKSLRRKPCQSRFFSRMAIFESPRTATRRRKGLRVRAKMCAQRGIFVVQDEV